MKGFYHVRPSFFILCFGFVFNFVCSFSVIAQNQGNNKINISQTSSNSYTVSSVPVSTPNAVNSTNSFSLNNSNPAFSQKFSAYVNGVSVPLEYKAALSIASVSRLAILVARSQPYVNTAAATSGLIYSLFQDYKLKAFDNNGNLDFYQANSRLDEDASYLFRLCDVDTTQSCDATIRLNYTQILGAAVARSSYFGDTCMIETRGTDGKVNGYYGSKCQMGEVTGACPSGKAGTAMYGTFCNAKRGCSSTHGPTMCYDDSSAQPVVTTPHNPATDTEISFALTNNTSTGLSQQRIDYLNSLLPLVPITLEAQMALNIFGPSYIDLPARTSSTTSSNGTTSNSSIASRINLSYSGSSIGTSLSETSSSSSSSGTSSTGTSSTGTGSSSSTTVTNNAAPVTLTKTQTGTSDNLVNCDKYPNASSCAELGTPQTNETVKNTSIVVSITAKTLTSSAVCPPPVPLNLHFLGASISTNLTYQPACDIAVLIKSVVLLLSALYSAYIFTNSFKV